MGLNIGDITFGVEAQTVGLAKAVNRIQNFRRVVDETAAAQQAGSSKAAAGLARQESAMKRALQQAISMRTEMKRLGAAPQDIAKVTHAIQRLTKEMSSGKLSTVQFTRSTDAFNTRMKRMNTTVKGLKMKEAAKRTSRFNEVVRDLESASVLAVGPLSGLGARVRALGAITSRSTLAIAGLLGAIAGLTVGLISVIRGTINASLQFGEMQARVTATTGSLVLSEAQLLKVGNIANSLGLDIKAAAQGFSALAAASRDSALEGNATIDIFEGLAAASAAMRLNSQQLEGAIRAVEQMMSKGTVQAEELRGQLGERIPGAFRLAAKAMGVSTKELNKMLKQGKVLSDDFLPKLGKQLKETFGDEAIKNADSLKGITNQLSNAVFSFFLRLDKAVGVSNAWKNVLQEITSVVKSLTDNLDILLGSIGAIGGALLAAFAPAIIGGILAFFKFLIGGTLIKGILVLAGAIRTAGSATAVLSIAMNTIPGVALLTVIGRIVAITAGAVFGFKLLAGAVDETATKTETLIKKLKAYNEVAEKQGSIHKDNAREAIDSAQKQIMALNAQTRAVQAQIQILSKEVLESPAAEFGAGLLRSLTLGLVDYASLDDIRELQGRLKLTTEQTKRLVEELEKLKKVEVRDPFGDTADEMSKELETFLKKIRESKIELEGLQFIMAVRPTTEIELKGFEQLSEARIDLLEFSAAEKEVIRNKIGEVFQQEFGTATQALAFFRGETNKTKVSLKAYVEALKNTPEVMRQYEESLDSLNRKTKAFRSGPLAVEAFETEERITKALQAQEKELRKINKSSEERTRLLNEYETQLRGAEEAEKQFSDASDRLASTVAGSIENTIIKVKKLRDAFDDLGQAIAQMLLRIMVIEPLQQSLRTSFQNSGVNQEVPQTRATGGPVMPGNLYRVNENGPEMLSVSGKDYLMMGSNRGAVTPSNGTGSGGGGGVTVNIINNVGAQVTTREQPDSNGGQSIEVLIDKAVARKIGEFGSSSNKMLRQNFGAQPKLASR